MAHSFTASPCLLEKGGASRPRGWRCWLRSSPASPPTTPSPDTPTLACPFFMAGKVLIPSAERWARVCGQERDCLQPPAVLGSSGPAGWPCSDMFILQAHCWPRLLAGPSGGLLLMGTGWRLGAVCVCAACSLAPSCFTFKRRDVELRLKGPLPSPRALFPPQHLQKLHPGSLLGLPGDTLFQSCTGKVVGAPSACPPGQPQSLSHSAEYLAWARPWVTAVSKTDGARSGRD